MQIRKFIKAPRVEPHDPHGVYSKQTKLEVDEAYQKFWSKNCVEKFIGPKSNPIPVRTDIPRVRPLAGNVQNF